MGRPREFDIDEALAKALHLFWRKGYEGTSMTDLTDAMGIAKPSLYATFGNKEELFRKALDSYQSTCMAFMEAAMVEPTAREVVEHLLFGFADVTTDCAHPPGCLETNGALVCSDGADHIRRELIARRAGLVTGLEHRLLRAQAAGDLSAGADPADLARYVMTVVQGMAVQAASGAGRDALHAVVRTALRAWPAG